MKISLRPQPEHASRKNAFAPGILFISPIIAALVPVLIYGPFWAGVAVFSLVAVSFLILLGVFVYHSICNPDALRSEEYSLRKDALQIYGQQRLPARDLRRIIESPPVAYGDYMSGQPESEK